MQMLPQFVCHASVNPASGWLLCTGTRPKVA